MIQPLKSSKTTWFLYWIDLEEPIPAGPDYFLPTLVVVCDSEGAPIAPPEVMEELDQARVEHLLLKLFDRHGTPDLLAVGSSPEWEEEDWRAFSQENHLDLRFQAFDQPSELHKLVKTVIFRYAAEEVDPASRNLEIARGLVHTALRLRSLRKKRQLLQAAIEHAPDFTQARIELADLHFQDGEWTAAMTAYEDVIRRDESLRERSGVAWWQDRFTRPLLRGYYGRGMTLWHQGRHLDAAQQFERLLAINSMDNQGVRFFLPLLYLLAEEHEEAASALERYEQSYAGDYGEPSFLFGWALSLHQQGREVEAKERYRRAILKNIYIAPMLLELTEPRRTLWHPNDRAEPGYAIEFLESYALLWDRDTGALRLLRETWEEMQSEVGELIAHRERISDFQDQRYEPDYKRRWQELVEIDDRLTSGEL